MLTSALFNCAKTLDVLKFMLLPHRHGEGGVEPVRKFCRQERSGSTLYWDLRCIEINTFLAMN